MPRFTKLPLISDTPRLRSLWDEELNDSLGVLPESLTIGTRTPVWWKCTNGLPHSFYGKAHAVNAGQGCSVCRGFQVHQGFNDFESNYPYQARRWNYIFNDSRPWEVTKSTHRYFWFICDEGHHFRVKLNDIHNAAVWCSYCSGNRIWPGDGKDLATTHPKIAEQIHPEDPVDLFTIGRGSTQKLRWVCPENGRHTWISSPNTRTNRGTGCPQCTPKRSKDEIRIFTWMSSELLPDYEVIANDSTALGCRRHIDIYVPKLNLGIEFNGNYWHSDKNDPTGTTAWKERRAKDLGILLITIWEDDWKADPDYFREVIRISAQSQLYDIKHRAFG